MSEIQYPLSANEQDIRILQFRQSITPELYIPAEIVDWSSIDKRLAEYAGAIDVLEHLIHSEGSNQRIEGLAESIRHEPTVLELILLVMAVPESMAFADGRSLPRRTPRTTDGLQGIAHLVEEIGAWRLLTPAVHLPSLVKTALIADDARGRRFRMVASAQHRIRDILANSCRDASGQMDIQLSIESQQASFPEVARRKVDYVIYGPEFPIAAVSTVVQTITGGRQQRDLRLTYPDLQEQLDKIPLKLILIADGEGMAKAPDSVLQRLFISVHAVMSIRQAESGYLTEAIVSAYRERSKPSAPVVRIIESVLMAGESVAAPTLPTSSDNARIALASYLDDHPALALSLTPGGETLQWERRENVRAAMKLRAKFEEAVAVDLLCDLLQAKVISDFEQRLPIGVCRMISIVALPFLPQEIFVASNVAEADEPLVRSIVQESVKNDARLALLVAPAMLGDGVLNRIQHIQGTLARNVVLVTSQMLMDWTMGRRPPHEAFSAAILEQSDLAKISPFVLQGRTPDRMYFGRAAEEATIVSTLATNSVAIIGSRRTGKTSLMHRVGENLKDAGYHALLADCQTVGNWKDFGDLVRDEWNVELPVEFRPSHLFKMMTDLKARANRRIVILLDEIDQLLSWDTSHPEDKVPEAFFRACRTLSQEGVAQFVFSGERTIAAKLWDPHSPHWNFCRALSLQQLDHESAEKLILQPLQALQVNVREREAFANRVWRYTSGHPQIAQYIGDKLVRRLNERNPTERSYLTPDDLDAVANSFEFKDHYIETYWGQATITERLITTLIIVGKNTPSAIIGEFESRAISDSMTTVVSCLRMLELYGLLYQKDERLELRAEWFAEALLAYGPIKNRLEQLWSAVA